ncbi:MAG: hypothetical protein ACOX8Q_07170 [Christensenellales bacterium]
MVKKHKKLFIFTVILFVLLAGGLTGFILARNEPRVVKENGPSEQSSDLQVDVNDAKISKNAMVQWDYEYKMCSHHIYLRCQVDQNMVGLSFSEFQEYYPDVRIVSFDTNELSLKKTFDCYCPDHYILKSYNQGLAIFRTILGSDEQEIYLEIQFNLQAVRDDEKQVLEVGKLFNSVDDLEHYIENIET